MVPKKGSSVASMTNPLLSQKVENQWLKIATSPTQKSVQYRKRHVIQQFHVISRDFSQHMRKTDVEYNVVEHLRSPRHALQILVGQTPGLPGLNIEAGQMGQPQGAIDQIKVLLGRFGIPGLLSEPGWIW
jgi:hypothetical protein